MRCTAHGSSSYGVETYLMPGGPSLVVLMSNSSCVSFFGGVWTSVELALAFELLPGPCCPCSRTTGRSLHFLPLALVNTLIHAILVALLSARRLAGTLGIVSLFFAFLYDRGCSTILRIMRSSLVILS